MSSEPTHVGWPQLPRIAQHLRLGRALACSQMDISVLKQDKDASGLLARFTESARYVAGSEFYAPPPRDGVAAPLDDYFSRFRSGVAEDLRRAGLQGTTSEEVNVVVEAAYASCSAVCSACTAVSGRACQFKDGAYVPDAQNLAAGGKCLESLQEWFQFCKNEAERAYSLALGKPVCQPIFLSTSFGYLAHEELSIGFTGDVAAHRDGSREVRIKFSMARFSPEDYFALPYVLFHECFAHGHCGVVPRKGSAVSFHEGWMDEVAARVLSRSLCEINGGRLPVECGEFEARMDEVRSERTDARRAGASKEANDWRVGVKACQAVVELFRQALVEQSLAGLQDESFDRFSMLLNASSDFSHESRTDLVRRISRKYVRGSGAASGAAIAADDSAKDAVRQFVATQCKDAIPLVHALVRP